MYQISLTARAIVASSVVQNNGQSFLPPFTSRRRYPQIYDSEQKLLVDASSVHVDRRDFIAAHAAITPASGRSAAAHARPLEGPAAAVLTPELNAALDILRGIFPPIEVCLAAAAEGTGGAGQAPVVQMVGSKSGARSGAQAAAGSSGGAAAALPAGVVAGLVQRPRLLICGAPGSGDQGFRPVVGLCVNKLCCHKSFLISSVRMTRVNGTPYMSAKPQCSLWFDARSQTPQGIHYIYLSYSF